MPRRTTCGAILLAAFLAFAQAPAEVEITNEPHHHFLFQNELVRVFYVEVAPGKATLIHRHRHDYIYVTLGDYEVSNDIVGKPSLRIKLHDGDTGFLAGNYAHSAHALTNTPLRNITVELLQDDKARQTPPSTWDDDRGLQVLPGGTMQIFFVKDGVRASEIELQPGGSIPQHHHRGPYLIVALTDLDLRSDVQGKTPMSAHLKSAEAQWIKGGFTHTLTNVGKQTARFVTLEFPWPVWCWPLVPVSEPSATLSFDRRAEPRNKLQANLLPTEELMPKVKAGSLTLNYEQQGAGEPMILIPYLAADHACYAFQVAEYAKHFTCISVDLRGTGESDSPNGNYTTEQLADDVAAFMRALGISKAHVAGLSLGAVTGIWLAAKHPEMVSSLSIHSPWTKTDGYQRTVIQSFQVLAKALGSVREMVIQGLFPWCLTPELYAEKPEYIQQLCDFVRSRPAQSLESFMQQSGAVLNHNVDSQLSRITAPTLITFGSRDVVTSPARFADSLREGIRQCELIIFDRCSHAPIYEKVPEFNEKTLQFLKRHTN